MVAQIYLSGKVPRLGGLRRLWRRRRGCSLFITNFAITTLFITGLMPARVIIPDGIIVHPGISIPSLDALALERDDAVRLGEAANIRVIPPGVVEHQSKIRDVRVLSGVGVVGWRAAPSITDFAPSGVAHFGNFRAAGVGGDTGRAEVVGQVIDRVSASRVGASPRGDALGTGEVVFRPDGCAVGGSC